MNFPKYFDAFPCPGLAVGDNETHFFFLKNLQTGKHLQQLRLDSDSANLEENESVLDEDLNSRSFRPLGFDAQKNTLYVIANEKHDEKYNLWKLDLSTHQLTKLTHIEFAAGGLLTKNFRYFYYGHRKIKTDRTFETTFKCLNLEIISAVGSREDLVHSQHKFLRYLSFDGLKIPTYWARPVRVPVRAAIVRDFYGGSAVLRALTLPKDFNELVDLIKFHEDSGTRTTKFCNTQHSKNS